MRRDRRQWTQRRKEWKLSENSVYTLVSRFCSVGSGIMLYHDFGYRFKLGTVLINVGVVVTYYSCLYRLLRYLRIGPTVDKLVRWPVTYSRYHWDKSTAHKIGIQSSLLISHYGGMLQLVDSTHMDCVLNKELSISLLSFIMLFSAWNDFCFHGKTTLRCKKCGLYSAVQL